MAVRVVALDDGFVGTALVGAYAAGGRVSDARRVFEGMNVRDVVAWGVMLDGSYHQTQRSIGISNHIIIFMGGLSVWTFKQGNKLHYEAEGLVAVYKKLATSILVASRPRQGLKKLRKPCSSTWNKIRAVLYLQVSLVLHENGVACDIRSRFTMPLLFQHSPASGNSKEQLYSYLWQHTFFGVHFGLWSTKCYW